MSKYKLEKDKMLLSLNSNDNAEKKFSKFEEFIVLLKSTIVYMPQTLNLRLTFEFDKWLAN